MKTLAELQAYIASRFPVVEGLPTALCQTGEPYVVLWFGDGDVWSGPGVLPEGSRAVLAFDEETAVNCARAAFDSYADDKAGTLYLRKPITLETANVPQWDGQRKRDWPLRYRVYLRLVISDKPVVFPDLAAYERGDGDIASFTTGDTLTTTARMDAPPGVEDWYGSSGA